MTRVRRQDRRWRLAAGLLGLLGMAGCGVEDAPELCKNHGPFHEMHRDELGSLSVTMTADGQLRSDVRLPMAIVGADSAALLETAGNVYTLQTASECAPATAQVTRQGSMLTASYESNCGASNKLGQLDVRVFDSLPLLEEIEVIVTTPVAEKHFAINRHCANAIFRLQ